MAKPLVLLPMLACSLILCEGIAWSAELGDMSVRTTLGQPLVAEISFAVPELSRVEEGEVEATFKCADGDCPVRIYTTLRMLGGGTGRLMVYSDVPVNSEDIRFVARLEWRSASGAIAISERVYTPLTKTDRKLGPGSVGVLDVALLSHAASPDRELPVRVHWSASTLKPAHAEQFENQQLKQEITSLVMGWLAAWSAKDMDTYFSFYANDYTPKGMERTVWIRERWRRIAGRVGPISVRCDRISVATLDNSNARVTCLQRYTADGVHRIGEKVIHFSRIDNRWRIVDERMGRERIFLSHLKSEKWIELSDCQQSYNRCKPVNQIFSEWA